MEKITVEEIRAMRPGKDVVKQLPDRQACHSARNLVSHVNVTYPVEGYRYTTSVRENNILIVKLEPKD